MVFTDGCEEIGQTRGGLKEIGRTFSMATISGRCPQMMARTPDSTINSRTRSVDWCLITVDHLLELT